VGAVRLTEAFLASDPPSVDEVRRLEAAVEKELGDLVRQLDGSRPLVAIGGTVRNLARMAQKAQRYPLSMLHGFRLTREALEEVTLRLLQAPVRERARLSGLNPDRADIIVAGALVYRWLLRSTGLDEVLISGHGVREGAFFRHFLDPPHLLPDVRSFSVRNRARQYPQPGGHVLQVRELAGRLFDGLAPLHGMSDAERDLLDAAATLHDSGTLLHYYRHEKHGAYMLTAAPLDGYTHRELALLALLVRYHRRGNPRLGSYAPLAQPGDKRRLRQLTTCLRLAESLERSRAGRVRDIEIEVGAKKAVLRLLADEEPTIELWEAQKHDSLFRRAFGRRLELEAAVRAGKGRRARS
jgi:exopolyphosphatase/guanosine-5'-triphosphate,3'-diphosphate pyrophosphatase